MIYIYIYFYIEHILIEDYCNLLSFSDIDHLKEMFLYSLSRNLLIKSKIDTEEIFKFYITCICYYYGTNDN